MDFECQTKIDMENIPSFENRESLIDGLIENLAEREGMNSEDIFSDIITFVELSKEDEDAKVYLEDIAESIGIPFEEMMQYAIKKARGN